MAKNEVQDEKLNTIEAPEAAEETDGKKKKGKKKEYQKSEEELYVETLSKEERKEYNKRKKALRRAQWVAEYWIIIVLAVAVFVVFCVLMIINYLGLSASSFFTDKAIVDMIDEARL
ncbi:MAG: hypothetical protein IJS93_00655 [Clostridia bacterium]|nr:hypothetical protein [Clostridia bacterium]